MKMTFRWYGEGDRIPLDYIRQIPNMYSVVTAVYDVPVGEVWSEGSILALKNAAESHGLKMEVIESVPVHEDIKLGLPTRDKYIDAYIENIRRLGKAGVKCICYNFMPVFDCGRQQQPGVLCRSAGENGPAQRRTVAPRLGQQLSQRGLEASV